ncbi:hypothetical protein GWI34_42850, partial [Actinomadura sp. DSM 109109]|nr:hypothetical protein [Actinomadura lepetitiana]
VHRSALKTIARPLALAAAAGLLVGGWWYVRNSALYGSPLWPFYATPWGDAVPQPRGKPPTFLGNIENTVRVIGTRYLEVFGGSLLLIAAAVLAPVLDRRRLVLGGAAATAFAVLAWANAPNTGTFRVSPSVVLVEGLVSTTRYLVAGVAIA